MLETGTAVTVDLQILGGLPLKQITGWMTCYASMYLTVFLSLEQDSGNGQYSLVTQPCTGSTAN